MKVRKVVPNIEAEKSLPQIYKIQIKKGMKFALTTAHKDMGAKVGDIVKVTSVTAMGYPSDGWDNDYENLRVSNGKFSWRISRGELKQI
jgi:hypothetical protein